MVKYLYSNYERRYNMSDVNLPVVKEDNIKKFWVSFTTWFEDELPGINYV